MAKQKVSLDTLDEEISRLRQQLEERESIKQQYGELNRQRQIVTQLRDRLASLALPDSIDERGTLQDSVDIAKDAIAAAQRAIFPATGRRGQSSVPRQRRASTDPEVLRQKEDFYFRRQAKAMAGLVDAQGRPKKRLNEDEQKKFEGAMKELKRAQWYPPELIKLRQKGGRR